MPKDIQHFITMFFEYTYIVFENDMMMNLNCYYNRNVRVISEHMRDVHVFLGYIAKFCKFNAACFFE